MAAWLANWLPSADPPDSNRTTAHVLELGAGEGIFTRHLLPRFATVTAVDVAPAMVSHGQAHCPQAQWHCGDAWAPESLPARHSGGYDWLASASLLQWCRQPVPVLERCAQLCAPDARLLHGFYVAPTLCEWETLFGANAPLGWRSAQQWLDAFAAAGWRVLRSELEVRTYPFANALELARSLHGTGVTPADARVGTGRYRALLREYDARFVAAGSAAGVVATWAFFRVEAQRAHQPQ